MRILLLEDELMLQSAIVEYLTATGYIVDAFEDGEEAYQQIKKTAYDLFVFDINTPSIDGLSLLEKLQKEKIHVPTVFISAITQIEQISKAYELGCYDYLKKPFHLKELTLHIERLLKMADIHSKSIVKLSRMYSYDLEKDRLLFDNVEQELKPKHQQIIRLLASNVERVVDFDMLRHYVWDDIHVDAATIRAEMHRVRQALKEDLIVSIKGIGYKLAKH
ncbi:response regulator transcription factor [Sulfurovum sp.]|jgi:DNA-binding response OmpR family regulator|uniref:response regulator transcription factor n=1 Tax=Sulfurovum sp. TaxID=1969726 RepID=UPI002A35C393|nr:response regulator transcription factor [Sulfurovum sp.]MDD2452209.1 response regulator transcription factor [Sulfurovum sp.]MDD3500632.1 response regulator transcription factor [Sulfurovum sp.]MDY0403600.1 response regulator transcription factor [Sulfurovum sp.]